MFWHMSVSAFTVSVFCGNISKVETLMEKQPCLVLVLILIYNLL